MFIPNSYDAILQETKSDHNLVGSAWSLFSFIVIVGLCVSAFNYLA